MNNIIILGSTGSIGTQSLELPINVIGLTSTGRNYKLFSQQINKFKPKFVALTNKKYYTNLKSLIKVDTKILFSNNDLLNEINKLNLTKKPIVLNAIDGQKGMFATIKSIELEFDLALANKESLVVAGAYIKKLLKKSSTKIYPVDSEHSAIYQCMQNTNKNVNKIILTASGGPFSERKNLDNITPKMALNHPTWNMGPLVTINSATLFNKALELIEAYYLFNIPQNNIIPIIHKQSIIHSAVEFIDGSTIAQLSFPDMKLPISLALNKYKCHLPFSISKPFNWSKSLTFESVNNILFPSIELGREALNLSEIHPCVLNASNEECVYAFLNNKLSFKNIFKVVEETLKNYKNYNTKNSLLTQIIDADIWSRNFTKSLILKFYKH
jgi:1-deoxy-D-xylulose-5-phosphate reductoisomerase